MLYRRIVYAYAQDRFQDSEYEVPVDERKETEKGL